MATPNKAGNAPVEAAALPDVGRQGIGAFMPGVDMPVDRLTARAAQLKALTTTLRGEGFDSFSRFNDEIRHDLLWLVGELADEVNELVQIEVCGGGAKA